MRRLTTSPAQLLTQAASSFIVFTAFFFISGFLYLQGYLGFFGARWLIYSLEKSTYLQASLFPTSSMLLGVLIAYAIVVPRRRWSARLCHIYFNSAPIALLLAWLILYFIPERYKNRAHPTLYLDWILAIWAAAASLPWITYIHRIAFKPHRIAWAVALLVLIFGYLWLCDLYGQAMAVERSRDPAKFQRVLLKNGSRSVANAPLLLFAAADKFYVITLPDLLDPTQHHIVLNPRPIGIISAADVDQILPGGSDF